MLDSYYPLITAIAANVVAQLLKPLFHYLKTKKVDMSLVFESGGFPSSHTALVVGLTLALAYKFGFDSTYFFISFVFSLTVIYDAGNVRYYSGQNIKMTKQLISDIEILTKTKLENPVYQEKLKEVLGHKWIEIIGGLLVGFVTASTLFFIKDWF